MQTFYCEYCGFSCSSANLLLSSYCFRHPNGMNKGKHKLYEGSEKTQYLCKYCGNKYTSIKLMTSSYCSRHPNGSNKGTHSPSL